MSGEVQLKTIADYQAAIQKLDRNKPEDMAKIKEYTAKIGEILQGNKEPIDAGRMDITTEMGMKISTDAKIAGDPQIKAQERYLDKDAIKDEFGSKLTDSEWKQLEADYEAAKKTVQDLDKTFKKAKPGDANYNQLLANHQVALAKLTEVQTRYDKEKIRRDISNGHGDGGIKKAAKHNVKNFTNVRDTQRVFTSKEEEELAIEKNPDLKGKTSVLKQKDQVALSKISAYAQFKIAQAEATGSEAEAKAAQEKWGEYADVYPIVYETDKDGNKVPKKETVTTSDGKTYEVIVRDYKNPDTKKAQNALVDESGFDQRFNADELETMSKMYHIKKGDVKSTVKKFGFGSENLVAQRFKAAGITAAATALGSFFGKNHSHQKALGYGEAEGQTVQGEVSWIASNGEEFYKYYEAQGGKAAVSVVAEACAKIPAIGQIAGPALAGVTAFFLAKPQTEDAFNGANVEAVLEDINLVEGKDNKAIVNNIQDMTITGDAAIDKAIKASVLKAALGDKTKKANTDELLAAYESLKDAKKAIGVIQEQKVEPPKPPKPTPQPEKPDLKVEHEDKTEKIRTTMPRLPYREGTWYTSHGYVDENGNKLSEAERRKVQAALRKDENMIGIVDTNNDGKLNGRDKEVSLPNEIEIDGKKYKLAPDARERIMKLPAKGGGSNGKYAPTVEYDRTTRKWFVKDNKTGNRIAGPYNTEKAAEAKKQEFLDNPDTIPKDK